MRAQQAVNCIREQLDISTHCPYCALQCGMRLGGRSPLIHVSGDSEFPVNRGSLCIKGWTAAETLAHPDRLLTPLRRENGQHRPVTWRAALSWVAHRVRETQARYGPDAVGIIGSGALTNEKAYLLGKFARVGLGTSQIDYNGRFCMSSAAAGANHALGIDRGLPFPLEDIRHAEVILLAGANLAETMPPIMQQLEAQRARGGKLIVVDPRASATAQAAALHLRLIPGSDIALANGLLHLIIRDQRIAKRYIECRTEGFDALKAVAASYWPDRVERITAVPIAQLAEAAQLLGRAKTAIILTGRGPEQQTQGVNAVLGYINLALALGLVGRPFSGYGTLTGQGNGQGGREHGQKADQLPGYRSIADPAARKHMAKVWGVPEQSIPAAGKSAYELLSSIGERDGIKALLVMGSNLVVSAPDAGELKERLRKLDFMVVADFFLSETASLAGVVLPAAQWAEEEGTTTNLEGRVLRRRRALPPPPKVKTDLEILCALAEHLGKKRYFTYAGPRQVFDELRTASSGGIADYAGITYEKIDASDGVFWPCPAEDHPGTPRLFGERFATPTGKARFTAVQYQGPAEQPDQEYPFYLTTGRILSHYQSGTQTRRVRQLTQLAPEPKAQIHPAVGKRCGLRDGETVVLSTRRVKARFAVELTPLVREDTIFVPFHWPGEQSANRLTHPALDPISRMPEFKVCSVQVEQPIRTPRPPPSKEHR